MKKILFATEFSGHAGQVFNYALDLAKRYNAKVYAMHACNIPLDPQESINEITVKKLDLLDEFVADKTTEKYENVEVETLVQVGFPIDAMLRTVKEEDIDFVVMGLQGKTSALNRTFGSVAFQFTNQCDVPVLLIPSTQRYKEITKIAYPMRFEFSELSIINEVLRLTIQLNAKLCCVHVNDRKELQKECKSNLSVVKELYLGNDSNYGRIYFDLKYGKFQEEIHNYIDEKEVDLLVMLGRKQNWKFRLFDPSEDVSVAQKITVPMLVWRKGTVLEKMPSKDDEDI